MGDHLPKSLDVLLSVDLSFPSTFLFLPSTLHLPPSNFYFPLSNFYLPFPSLSSKTKKQPLSG